MGLLLFYLQRLTTKTQQDLSEYEIETKLNWNLWKMFASVNGKFCKKKKENNATIKSNLKRNQRKRNKI